VIAIVHTRTPRRLRVASWARCVYLRWLISNAEKDRNQHRAMLAHAQQHLPKQIALDEKHIDDLTKKLVKESQK
jgi:hypothetical protein